MILSYSKQGNIIDEILMIGRRKMSALSSAGCRRKRT